MPSSDPPFDRRLAAIFQAEAAEHVQRMEACLARLEQSGAGDEAIPSIEILFRSAHSLKGAARAVGEQEVETVCHATESLLAGVQNRRLPWSTALADALHEVVAALDRGLIQRIGPPGSLAALLPRLRALERPGGKEASGQPGSVATISTHAPEPSPSVSLPAPPTQGHEQTVRISVERLDRLLYRVEDLVAARTGAGRQLARLDEALASSAALRAHWAASGPEAAQAWKRHQAQLRSLRAGTAREQRHLAGAVDALLDDVKTTLLLPVGSLSPFLSATVRELARSQGKDIDLRIHGEEVEMDRRLLDELRGPLTHLLRNAADHGIEAPAQRLAAGKPARGQLEIRVAARSGGRVEVRVADDGAGIDTLRLESAARAMKLPLPQSDDPSALLPLVFGPGVSTADRLTTVSGRGLGLPIVRETIERLGGSISVQSQAGLGTAFVIQLMPSLATYRAIEVKVAGRSLLLPTPRIERCLRVAPSAARTTGARQTLPVGDADLPLVNLAALLGLPAATEWFTRMCCVVLVAGDQRIAVAVDEIGGEQEVLGRPVETAVARNPVVTGAASLGPGVLAPILNVPELVRMALAGAGGTAPASVPRRTRGRSLLLAEDSITSRTLLKNILELAGHRVEVAVDGMQALEKLRAGTFDAVVSDVEMPRLDGVGLTQAIRRDPALSHLPVVLVTSLGSPADRERGAEAGANAYIVKRGFDQGNLLKAIAEVA